MTNIGGFMIKNLFVLSFLFASFNLSAHVQSLSLDDSLDLAAENNSELQSQRIQLEAAERKAKTPARHLFLRYVLEPVIQSVFHLRETTTH